MNALKFLAGGLSLFVGLMMGAGEMPDASFAAFLLEKLLAFALIIAGFVLIEKSNIHH